MSVAFFYVPGNLDSSINHFAELNDIYRLCGSDEEFEECIRYIEQMDIPSSARIPRSAKAARGLTLNLVPYNNGQRSLVLEGPLMNLDEAVYESCPTRMNHETVREAGRKLIRKHGEFHVRELAEMFQEKFGAVFEEDYGTYEVLMLEFFLQNLPMLNALDLEPVKY